MRKRGHCWRPVSTVLVPSGSSVTLVFFYPSAQPHAQFQGEPLQRGRKIYGGGKNLRFSTEIAVYLGNGRLRYRPMVAMER